MNALELKTLIIEEALDGKANHLVCYDMEGKSSITDYVVICHGTSTTHSQGIADKVYLALKKRGMLPLGIEGAEEGRWILMDYDYVIIHIFLEDTRNQYLIEELYQSYPAENYE